MFDKNKFIMKYITDLISHPPFKYFFFFLLGISNTLIAQEVVWQKDMNSSKQEILTGMSFTPDSQIILFGSSISGNDNNQNTGYDYHIVKLSQKGEKILDKFFTGSKNDYLQSVSSMQDGGYVLAGTSFSNKSNDKKENNNGGSDIWIIRLDENGNELWQKTIGTSGNEVASRIVESLDKSIFITGNIQSNKQFLGLTSVFVSKLDQHGDLTKSIVLGGSSIDQVTDMITTPDGGVALLVYSTSMKFNGVLDISEIKNSDDSDFIKSLECIVGKDEDSYGEGDFWIVKLDSNLNVEWQKYYGGEKDDYPKNIIFSDSGYLIGGESYSGSSGNKKEDTVDGADLWLISLDNRGNELWQKSYSLGGKDVLMSIDVIRTSNKNNQSSDKGYLLGGYTKADDQRRKNDEQFWMLYIDNEGNEEWRKYTKGNSSKKEEHLVSAKLQNDGTYILAGTSGDMTGDEIWKILKLQDEQLSDLMIKYDIRIYPNPSEEYCFIELGFELEKNDEVEISLFDMSGRKVHTTKSKNTITKIDTNILPAGVYVVTVKSSKKTVNAKLVKK